MSRSLSRQALVLIIGAVLSPGVEALAQDSTGNDAESETSEEQLLESIEDEEAATTAAEILSWLRENPIDLNNAKRDELLSIPGVSAEDADAILRFRETEGQIESLEEVRGLPGGEDIALRLRPYVSIPQAGPKRRSKGPPAVLLSTRLSGFLPGSLSSPPAGISGGLAKSFSRLSLRFSEHIQAGLLFEKDAGERIRDGFPSGYLLYRGGGILEQLVLGDFCAEAGQGLVLSRGIDFGRNGRVADGIRRSGARLVPYHLTDESHYLRGGACALKGKPWGLPVRCLLVASRTSLGATLNDRGEVRSFYTSGLYRTEEEMEKRNSVREFLAATRLECDIRGKGTVGLTYYRSVFDRVIAPSSSNEFSGVESRVAGADISWSMGPAGFFGEYARVADGGTAWIAGLVVTLDSMFKASIACRDYPGEFHNPHARGYGVLTSTTNERGISVGWSVRLARGLSLEGCADQCKIPASTYTSFLPRTAANFFIQAMAVPVPWARLSFCFRTRKTEMMQAGPDLYIGSAKVQGYNDRTSARFAARIAIPPFLEMRVRIEHGESRYSETGKSEQGNMASQALRWNAGGAECELGVAFFECDSYDTRLYDYEGNLRGSVASPGLYGKGSRWHVLVSWEAIPWARLAAKYAVTLVEKSPVARDLAVQVELRF